MVWVIDGCGSQSEAQWAALLRMGAVAQGWAGAEGLHLTPEHSLCTHSPSVQFLESSRVPLQSRPPFWGGGAMHSRLRQCAHSVLQADHLLHSVHAPSTVGAQYMRVGAQLWVQTTTQKQSQKHTRTHVPKGYIYANQQTKTISTQPQVRGI